MRVPVPKNKLVAFTLVGAVLTAGVAGALALPGGGLAQADSPDTTGSDASQQVGDDAPTPNKEFTPAVQTQSGYEDDEHDEDEDEADHEDDEHDEDEADHEDDEHDDEDEEE